MLVVMQMHEAAAGYGGKGRGRVVIGLTLELDGADEVPRQP